MYIFRPEERNNYLRAYTGARKFSNYSAINTASRTKDKLVKHNKILKKNQTFFMKIKKERASSFYYGLLIYYGYDIVKLKEFKEYIYVELKKKKDVQAIEEKKYSWLIKLPRTGLHGKRIYVYKLRTMQPFSEYLHDYIVRTNGLDTDGTIKDDYRITNFGKFVRKYWLDELPMLLNWLKGDLKLIGVRPLSDTMLNQYPEEYLPFRHKYKPGLIPPYYIDKPKTFESIIESEQRYLTQYEKQPIRTDISYFIKFLKVVFRGVRSS